MDEGEYQEIFNSDKDVYGGYNQYNGALLKAIPGNCFAQPYLIEIKIASFGAMIFKKINQKKNAKKSK
jgi:1,4-alpha-glucan branching enzyme